MAHDDTIGDLPPLPPEAQSRHPYTHTLHSVSTQSTDFGSQTNGSRPSTRHRSSRASKESHLDDITRLVQRLKLQLEDERRRADDAERRVQEVTGHLKAVNDARLAALGDAARAKEELKLYRIQLDAAQREIYRAQDVIETVDKQRHNAEKEAAKHRSKTRELNETILIQTAHTEAYRLGMEEGLNRGRELANANAAFIGGGQEEEYSDEENQAEPAYPPLPPDPPRIRSEHSRAQRSEHSRAPRSEHSRAPTHTRASPASIQVPLPNPSIDPSENIRPISIRNVSSSPRPPTVAIPPDNLIPTLDPDMRIRIPPPHEFRHRTPEPPPSPQLPAMSDSSQEPLPILPRANNPQQRRTRHRRNSSSGSNSSTLSQLDIINSAGPGLRTPMSIIPEVSSAYSGSPLPRSEDGHRGLRHQRSVSDYSVQRPKAPSIKAPSISEGPSAQNRPHSRSSYAGSWLQHKEQPSQSNRDSRISTTSTAPKISVQPPSRPVSNKTDSLRGGGHRGGSPSSYRTPLPPDSGSQDPHYGTSAPNTMPGGYGFHNPRENYSDRPVIPSSSRYDKYDDDDDAVSSAFTADTFTTNKYRANREDDWSGAVSSASHVPMHPTGNVIHMARPSSSTGGWSLPEPALGVTMINSTTKGKSTQGVSQ